MTKIIKILVLLLLALPLRLWATADKPSPDFFALCYHDVVDHQGVSSQKLKAQTVSTDTLIRHFNWLKQHGYQPVSFQDLLDAREGIKPLPEKAVLLTFDDGYRSFHTHVLPLLKLYRYPAVLALVGQWLEVEPGKSVSYGDKEKLPRSDFLTWDQLREIRDSGLVEIASHSYDLHQGVIGNPFDNLQPAAITRGYDPASGQYEKDGAFKRRIESDISRNQALLEQRLGIAPRIMVWPYGAYSQEGMVLAGEHQVSHNFTLDGVGHNWLNRLDQIDRLLVKNEIKDTDLRHYLKPVTRQPIVRLAHVDLDYLYDEDKAQQARNLDKLLDRVKELKINTVYLQAFADPDGNGNADALYFPNRHLPMRADLFNRVAWQLKTRAEVEIYAWMPVLSFSGMADPVTYVENSKNPGVPSMEGGYLRLSPFNADNRKLIKEIYADLARYAHFDGLLFHDDAYLTEDEDASASLSGLTEAKALTGNTRLMRHKTQGLIQFTRELAEVVSYYRGNEVRTARNLYARVILEPESERWLAQNFQDFIEAYDYTAVMAMPYLEGSSRPIRWLKNLAAAVHAQTTRVDKVVFELQTVDWRTGRAIGNRNLRNQLSSVNRAGIQSFGYYPEDFVRDYPSVKDIRPVLSLSQHPYRRR